MLSPETVSVQLFTLRQRLADDFEGTLAELAEIGFRHVEPFRFMECRRALITNLPKYGLSVPIASARLWNEELELDDGLGEIFETASAMGASTVLQASSNRDLWASEAGISRVADALNVAASEAAKYGLGLAYHNHAFEVEATFGARTGLDVLHEVLDDAVQLEVDTYWAFVGGANVLDLLTRLGSRVVALHLKDGDGTPDTSKQVAVGQGVLPIMDFVRACPSMQLGVIELDNCATDRMQAVRDSFAFLVGNQ